MHPAQPPRIDRERRLIVLSGLLLVLLLASLDSTIVATALPTIVGEFGGLSHLSWVVTAYLLAQTVVTPLYGKVGDLYGRKRVLQSAILLFLCGSVLCGLSTSLSQLIVFRAIQGFGGGGLLVSTQAVIGDIVPPRERGRYQGLFGAVYGVSSIAGPLIGGFLTTQFSWRWIFYVNLPLGAIALTVLAVTLPRTARRKRRRIDYAGSALLAAALAAIVLLTDLGGSVYPWRSLPIVTFALTAIVALLAFIAVESRAAEPVLPLRLFGNRVFAVTSGIGFIVGFALFGSVTYVPLFLQVVKRSSPTASGLELLPMMGGMLVTSIASGHMITRSGRYKRFPIAGTALMAAGLFLLSRLDAETPRTVLSIYLLMLGLGMGMVMQVLVLAVQNAVEYEELGVATSGATLFRFIGGSVGTAALGTVFAAGLAARLERLWPGGHPPGLASMAHASPATIAALPADVRAPYLEAFAASLGALFFVACIATCAALLLAIVLEERPLRETVSAGSGVGESFAMPCDGDSLTQISHGVWALLNRETKRHILARTAQRARIYLSPLGTWLLGRVRDDAALDLDALARDFDLRRECLGAALDQLYTMHMVTEPLRTETGFLVQLTSRGKSAQSRLAAARRANLADLLRGWSPEQHRELAALVRRLARDVGTESPG